MAALQRDLPEFTLRHASETYTVPVKDWPGIFWSHRLSDDALATRVTIDIDTATANTITTTLWIGHQAPNITSVRQLFHRTGSHGNSSAMKMGRRCGFEGARTSESAALRWHLSLRMSRCLRFVAPGLGQSAFARLVT